MYTPPHHNTAQWAVPMGIAYACHSCQEDHPGSSLQCGSVRLEQNKTRKSFSYDQYYIRSCNLTIEPTDAIFGFVRRSSIYQGCAGRGDVENYKEKHYILYLLNGLSAILIMKSWTKDQTAQEPFSEFELTVWFRSFWLEQNRAILLHATPLITKQYIGRNVRPRGPSDAIFTTRAHLPPRYLQRFSSARPLSLAPQTTGGASFCGKCPQRGILQSSSQRTWIDRG